MKRHTFAVFTDARWLFNFCYNRTATILLSWMISLTARKRSVLINLTRGGVWVALSAASYESASKTNPNSAQGFSPSGLRAMVDQPSRSAHKPIITLDDPFGDAYIHSIIYFGIFSHSREYRGRSIENWNKFLFITA